MRQRLAIMTCVAASLVAVRAAQTYQFERTNSFIEIHLGTDGALGFAGHEHLIRTPIQTGVFVYDAGDLPHSSVELAVAAAELRVLDPGLAIKDKEKIQATMESERVLGARQFSAIKFKSTAITAAPGGQLKVTGNLTIRDKTRQVSFVVLARQAGSGIKATGQCQLRQTDFGIKPVSAGLGTVRVKDLMTIEFEISGRLPGRKTRSL